MTRGEKRVRSEQLERARALYVYLGGHTNRPDKSIEAIADWLARDYRLGMDAHRRAARKRRDAIGSAWR